MRIALLATWDGILVGRFLAALLQAGVAVDCVLLDPKPVSERDLALHELRTRGRLVPLPLHDFAAARIPLFAVPSHNDPIVEEFVRTRSIQILVNAGTPRILRSSLLAALELGVLNCHPGLLPDYRGSSCVEWALYNGSPVGNTVHLMSGGIDEGPMLWAEPVSIGNLTSYSAIRTAVYEAGFALMARACADLQAGRIDRTNFRTQPAGSYYRPIDETSMAALIARFPEAT